MHSPGWKPRIPHGSARPGGDRETFTLENTDFMGDFFVQKYGKNIIKLLIM